MRGGARIQPKTQPNRTSWAGRAWLAVLVAALACVVSAERARAQTLDREFQFDIPSQPLAAALRSFSMTTGLEFFYDGSLSIGRRSSAVKGTLKASLGLRELLHGTGYSARATDIADTVTIVESPSVAGLRATFSSFEPYFAAVQARLSEALCDSDELSTDGKEITFRFWLDASGVVSHAELVDQATDAAWSRAFITRVRGLQIRTSPPAGLPQPLTMVIYPPMAGESAGCAPPATGGSRRAANEH